VQAQLVVHRLVTSHQPVGTLSAFSYADRIVDFLGTLLGVVPMVLFPQFITHALDRDRTQLQCRVERVIATTSLVSFPFTVWLLVLSQPLIALLFQRGRFDALATLETARALRWLAVALFAWNVWGVCKTVAYAVQRPDIVNRAVIGTSAGVSLLALTIGRWWGLDGIALSWAMVPSLMSVFYLWMLRGELPAVHRIVWNDVLLRVTLAAMGMGLGCWALHEGVWDRWIAPAGWLLQAAGLVLFLVVGLGGYWLLLVLFGVALREDLLAAVRRSLRRPTPQAQRARGRAGVPHAAPEFAGSVEVTP